MTTARELAASIANKLPVDSETKQPFITVIELAVLKYADERIEDLLRNISQTKKGQYDYKGL